tara:strand:- start:772 stop:1020 length:249 start_codon:yes stop_codon:yes gene_type:complete
MSKRNFKISRKEGELYNAKVTDSYGNEYQNWFEYASEANDWVYYIWEQEDWFNKADSMALLDSAIQECIKMDEERGKEPILD